MREIVTFIIVLVVSVTILAGVVYFFGASFGLNIKNSWFLALTALVITAPGAYCIYISVSDEEPRPIRLVYLIRGIGMLIITAALVIPIFTTIRNASVIFWGIVIGLVLNFGTWPIEDKLRSKL